RPRRPRSARRARRGSAADCAASGARLSSRPLGPRPPAAMNVVVCVKRVPATDTRIRVAADGRSLDPQGVEFVLTPSDEFALEEGLRLREKAGSGEVVVLTLGPSEAQKELRTCLAVGADRAILLKDDAMGSRDGFAIASILAA